MAERLFLSALATAPHLEKERFAKMEHRDEETGLDPTHYRMYSSTQGRWQSPDPVRPCVHHPQQFERDQYAANNPTNRTDPKGAFILEPVGCDPFYDPYCVCDPFFGCRDELAYGYFWPEPSREFLCEMCRFECEAKYAAYAGACITKMSAGPGTGLSVFECEQNARSFFTNCQIACADGVCNFGAPW